MSGTALRVEDVPQEPARRETGIPEPATSPDPDELRRALAGAVSDPRFRSDLHLLIECLGESGWRSVEVFGTGVGIWNGVRQFRLSSEELSALLAILEEADFAGLANRYGGRKPADLRPPQGDRGPASAIEVTCRIELALGGLEKSVAQVAKGEQSPVLRRLADDLLDLCRSKGESGRAAADLDDGLEKISRSELAPEVLSILVGRKPDRTSSEQEAAGFLLRLSGPRVVSRGWDPVEGYLEALVLDLSSDEARDLARQLAEADPTGLPENLWARDYTDLTIELLNHETTLQARQFARMTPSTHGERQRAFESIFDLLFDLHRRVLAEGRPIEPR